MRYAVSCAMPSWTTNRRKRSRDIPKSTGRIYPQFQKRASIVSSRASTEGGSKTTASTNGRGAGAQGPTSPHFPIAPSSTNGRVLSIPADGWAMLSSISSSPGNQERACSSSSLIASSVQYSLNVSSGSRSQTSNRHFSGSNLGSLR